MKYQKGDRVLYNRQRFGTVKFDHQYDDHSKIAVIFDRDAGRVALVRTDMLELVADAQHEAHLATLVNTPAEGAYNIAGELLKIAEELSVGADSELNVLRLRTTMKSASLRLRGIAEDV